MLGIGNALPMHSAIYTEVLSYTSDFTSTVDGWSGWNIEDSSSDLSLTPNTDGFDGQDNWLKGEFDLIQTGTSGIQLSGYGNVEAGDFSTITCTLHLSEDWDGEDTVLTAVKVGDEFVYRSIAQDQTTTFTKNIYHDANSSLTPKIYWAGVGDMPQGNAIFHIKDIVIKTYRLTLAG